VPQSLLKISLNNARKSLIYSALSETLKSQPILGVTIEDEQSNNPKWARLDKIDLREIVNIIREESPSTSDKWIQAGHQEPLVIVEELPVWRVVMKFQEAALTTSETSTFSFTMAFFCHHAIADGLSAGAFNLTFLDALNYLIDHPLQHYLQTCYRSSQAVARFKCRTEHPTPDHFLLHAQAIHQNILLQSRRSS
jgi:hypothetical protein